MRKTTWIQKMTTILTTVLLIAVNVGKVSALEYVSVPVAAINGQTYISLQAAIDDVDYECEPVTIMLVKDIELTERIEIPADKYIILDLNDHTIKVNTYGIYNAGNLTITDYSEGGTTRYFVFKDTYYLMTTDQYANVNKGYERVKVSGGAIWGKVASSTGEKYWDMGPTFLDVIQNCGTLTLDKGNIVGNCNVSGYTWSEKLCGNSKAAAVHNMADAIFVMNGGNITGNYIMGINKTGAVYNEGNATLNGGTISCNFIDENGGGVYNSSSLVVNDTIISYNFCHMKGAGIYNEGRCDMAGGQIFANLITADTDNGYGAGLYNATGSAAYICGGTIGNNCSNYGAGIANDGDLYIEAGTITKNYTYYLGGGLYNNAYCSFTGGTVSANISAISAGGIYNSNAAYLSISGGYVTNNRCDSQSGSAGGVYNEGAFHMPNGEITGNTGAYGGGIYNIGYFEMTNGKVSNNTVSNDGGGIYNAGNIVFKGGAISSNLAMIGGGLFENAGSFTMAGGSISDNEVVGDNSAIYSTSTLNLLGGQIINNKKPSSGYNNGAVWVDKTSNITLGGKIVIKNNTDADNAQCNLYLNNYDYESKKVSSFNVSKDIPLEEGAEVHVTLSNDCSFLEGIERTTVSQYFVSDDESMGVHTVKDGDKYNLDLKKYLTLSFTPAIGGNVTSNDIRCLPDDVITLPTAEGTELGDYNFGGWILTKDAPASFPYASEGAYTYTVKEEDATDNIISFYQVLMPKVSDIDGDDEKEVIEFTERKSSDTTIHITGLETDQVKDDNLSNVVVRIDKNGNGSFEENEKLTYGRDYGIQSGSIKVVLYKSYLDTLKGGTHKVDVKVISKLATDFQFESTIVTEKGTSQNQELTYHVVNTSVR